MKCEHEWDYHDCCQCVNCGIPFTDLIKQLEGKIEATNKLIETYKQAMEEFCDEDKRDECNQWIVDKDNEMAKAILKKIEGGE